MGPEAFGGSRGMAMRDEGKPMPEHVESIPAEKAFGKISSGKRSA
jgi:hypothetical protein